MQPIWPTASSVLKTLRLSSSAQQIIAAFVTIPRFLLQMIGSVILVSALSWQLALPVVIWIALNVVYDVTVVPSFAERSRRTAKQRSLVAGAITDLYASMQMIKRFAAEKIEAGAIRSVIETAVGTQQREQRVYRASEFTVVVFNTLLWLSMLSVGFPGFVKGSLSVGEFAGSVYIVRLVTTFAMAVQEPPGARSRRPLRRPGRSVNRRSRRC